MVDQLVGEMVERMAALSAGEMVVTLGSRLVGKMAEVMVVLMAVHLVE